ncbi:MAG: DUF4105 domain-containing protein [Elusimicrobia bacterium]|nr:DUF4105 domain-containing protein [Elusimicrobiota bacterium]
MLKNLSFLVLFAAVPAAAQTSFEALETLNVSQIRQLPSDLQLPEDKSWGASYTLKGVISVTEDGPYINTVNGRLFKLDLSEKKASRYEGKTVILEAQARQADDLSILKVGKITEYLPKAGEIEPAPYQPRRRQAMLLEDKDGIITMGNVRTMHTQVPPADSYDWTSMTMHPEKIKNVYFVKKPFPPEFIAAHSFLVFTFEKGALKDADGNEPMALALSIEGRTRVGQSFSPLTGLGKSFGIIWSLSTWEEYAARTVYHEKFHLITYPVLLTHDQKADLLREAMQLSAVDREGEFYHTIKNNCTNNLLILMNRVLPKERQIKMWTIPYMVYNVRATLPQFVIGNLQKRGLLGDEFADIHDAQTLSTVLP